MCQTMCCRGGRQGGRKEHRRRLLVESEQGRGVQQGLAVRVSCPSYYYG